MLSVLETGMDRQMRFSVSAAFFAAILLGGCMGPEGNSNRQPYANEPGGVMAVRPETIGKVAYDPYATPAPFTDMQSGQVAISPPPPMSLPPAPPAARPRY
jgi:hypothetical protein